jgi:hypothetical protein
MSTFRLLIFVVTVGIFLHSAAFAHAFSTLYFSPQRKAIDIGGSQEVVLRLNTDNEQINALSAYITYPSDKISVAIENTSSQFPVVAESNASEGHVGISVGSFDAIKGDVAVATLKITGKQEGSATLSFTSESAVTRYEDSSDSLSLSRSIGGYYTINAASHASDKGTKKIFPWQELLRLQEELRRQWLRK